jgi:hypothetical protein
MSDFKRTKALEELIEAQPLLVTEPSIKGINPRLDSVSEGTIYYGTGLCTPKHLSRGFPFDLLSMLLVAEQIRRTLHLRQVIHLIADSHALNTRPDDGPAIAALAVQQRDFLQSLVKNLGFDSFDVLIASEFDHLPSYTRILDQVPADENEYIRREITDIEWLSRERGLCLKVGWIIQAKETSLGFDERVFHRRYLELVESPMSFVYAQAGRTLDKKRPKAAPYIVSNPEKRVVLKGGEQVAVKLTQAESELSARQTARLREYYSAIVALFEQLVEPLNMIDLLEDKMQYIIQKACEGA